MPELGSGGFEIADKELYFHQMRALIALNSGKNLILRSGTGSGKTEAWFLYVAKKRLKAMAIYPTLALANDQVKRLKRYCEALGMKAAIVDAPTVRDYSKSMGTKRLREEISSSNVVITNPAFLLNELKKFGTERPPYTRGFLEDLDVLVIDDLDFYNPRSLAIMLAMMAIVKEEVSPKVRFAILTAMLKDPTELAEYVRRITEKGVEVVDGMPIRPKNFTYVVLGKDLRALWEKLRASRDALASAGVGRDVLESLEDYDRFKSSVYKVLEVARSTDIELSEDLGLNPIELLERYASDDGITLVFTKSIAKAEEIARALRERVGDLVASHHHLLEKSLRAEIEERARLGNLKLLISPRTLSQGIDIGHAVRTVHVGLPDSLREFLQKEGRKGRREEIERTETVIFPASGWDYNLLRRGPEVLLRWLTLPREVLLAHPGNKYVTLVKGLIRLSNPNRAVRASQEELELLGRLGLRDGLHLNERGKRALLNLNFYEFAPPYGIKRVRRSQDVERFLEEISHADLVEKFQIGCIDYTSDGVVTSFVKPDVKGRVVTGVVVEDLVEHVMRRYEPLAYVLEEYRSLTKRWGTTPDLRRDFKSGLIHSDVLCVVRPPDGFNRYVKVPNRTIWTVRSRRPRVMVVGEGKTIVVRDGRALTVPAVVDGVYSDYSYGTTVELDPRAEPDLTRLGAAFIELVMRRALCIPFETIKYDVAVMGERKFLTVHEPDSAGLIERLDWIKLKDLTETYQPDELDEALLEGVNELAYSTLVAKGMDWEVARHYAIAILERFIARERIRVEFRGRELVLPRPSRALRRATVLVYSMPFGEASVVSGTASSPYELYAVAVFDGETIKVPVGVFTPEGPDEAYLESSAYISKLVDQGFTLYAYDLMALDTALSRLRMRSLRAKLTGLQGESLLVDLSPYASKLFGPDHALRDIVESIRTEDSEQSMTPIDVLIKSVKVQTSWKGWRERAINTVSPALENLAKQELTSLYLLSLMVLPKPGTD
ncbi:MAG: DEAD/DEAH box helicase [Thaumarchaeota archaeon]|nr:DEAD/DEAH box helicase [Candidatus Calditenuaceae archaeon]MDW8186438.1 DEAD/DEAH box helicase [Nitrososphaerota archaeon]